MSVAFSVSLPRFVLSFHVKHFEVIDNYAVVRALRKPDYTVPARKLADIKVAIGECFVRVSVRDVPFVDSSPH